MSAYSGLITWGLAASLFTVADTIFLRTRGQNEEIMAALPYIQLYVADYLADTIHLSTEEHGAYMLLIMNYWQTGKPLPKNRLQAISKLDNERWTLAERTLSEYFIEDADGNWVHERIEMDLNKVKSKSIQASKAGKKSAEARALKSKDISTDVEHHNERTLNHTDTEADTDTDKPTTQGAKPKASPVPYQSIIDLYHEKLPNNPRIAKLSESRKRQIKARWNNGIGDLEAWCRYFEMISSNKFLTGQSPPGHNRTKPFIADIDFIIKEANVLKIVEGKYE